MLAHIIEKYVGRKVDFNLEVKLVDDGNGNVFIESWKIKDLSIPTEQQIKAIYETYKDLFKQMDDLARKGIFTAVNIDDGKTDSYLLVNAKSTPLDSGVLSQIEKLPNNFNKIITNKSKIRNHSSNLQRTPTLYVREDNYTLDLTHNNIVVNNKNNTHLFLPKIKQEHEGISLFIKNIGKHKVTMSVTDSINNIEGNKVYTINSKQGVNILVSFSENSFIIKSKV